MASTALISTNSSQIAPSGDFCTSARHMSLYTVWFVVYLLCLPVFLSALYAIVKKLQNSSRLSHADILTSHIVLMELLNTVGSCVLYHGIYTSLRNALVSLAIGVNVMTHAGQICIYSLTCVEHYLAVVRPVAYLRLKQRGGVTLRNTCVALAWLLSAGFSALTLNRRLDLPHYVLGLLLTLLSLAVVSYCTVSTFCVLIRPAPGEGGGDRKSVNRSKRAALNSVALIVGAQLLGLLNAVVFNAVALSAVIDPCLLSISSLWFQLPNRLALPLHFLHRAKTKELCK